MKDTMNEPTLILSNGQKVTREQLRDYFALVLEAEQSGEPFPVDLDYVWLLAYSTKGNAKRALLESSELFEKEDYHFIGNDNVVNRPQGGGVQPDKIFLSVSCLEFFIARKVRPIFEIYRQCRKMVFERARSRRLPYHIRRYVINHPQIPFGYLNLTRFDGHPDQTRYYPRAWRCSWQNRNENSLVSSK